jgi:hypothetical protein
MTIYYFCDSNSQLLMILAFKTDLIFIKSDIYELKVTKEC